MAKAIDSHEVAYALACDYQKRCEALTSDDIDVRDLLSRRYYTLLTISEALVLKKRSLEKVNEIASKYNLGTHEKYLTSLERLYQRDYPEVRGITPRLLSYKTDRVKADYGSGLTSVQDLDTSKSEDAVLKLKLEVFNITQQTKKLFKIYRRECKRGV